MHVMGGGDVGGAKTQIMNTVTGLNRNNDVMLISFRAGPFADEARERGIDVRVIERHNPFRAARTMRDLVDAFKPDIIHCHGGRANLMGAMVRRSRQVPIVTTVHSDYRLDYLGSPLKQYTLGTANAIALRFLDFYQPVADRMARTLIERGFDRVIDVWGADHHGHAIRFAATMRAPALGLEGRKLDFLIMQMVRLMRGDEIVKVSKRTGKALSLADLMDEIGVDACRFFFNAKPDSHLEFDLDLAIRQDSENPVYYVQYAHARICTLLAAMAEVGCAVPAAADVDVALLTTPQEHELIKQIAMLPEEIHLAARDYDPSRINRYVTELAARFHRFYNVCRIKDAEPAVRDARLKLADTTRRVLEIGLDIIGVTAPEKM